MPVKTISQIKSSIELYNQIASLNTPDDFKEFFGDELLSDYSFLSSIDPDTNLPFAHVLVACPRFVFSDAAQNPEILNIKDKLGYPLSFRLLCPLPINRVPPGINARDNFINELILSKDKRFECFQNGVMPEYIQNELKHNPKRIWIFTDAAKVQDIIDKTFTAVHDPKVWHFHYTESEPPTVQLTPMEGILAGAYGYKSSRELVNLAYREHPDLIAKLEAYAALDKFDNPIGFIQGFPSVGAVNALTLIRIASLLQSKNMSMDDYKQSSGFNFISKHLLFLDEFHKEITSYIGDATSKLGVLRDLSSTNSIAEANQLIGILKTNMDFFRELIQSEHHQTALTKGLVKLMDSFKNELDSIKNLVNSEENILKPTR